MGRRANLLDIMEFDDVFDEYMAYNEYKNMGKIGDMMFLSLKNQILEQRIHKLEDEVNELKEKLEKAEEIK